MGTQRKSAPEIVFIVGPTAVGKTGLAVRLAKKVRGEIVSCDSMQAYKDMPVLSQAPPKDALVSIRHHLIGCIPPEKEFSVAEYRRRAAKKIKEIIARGKRPIVVGGSGLYAKALIDGLFTSPGADKAFRERMRKAVARQGPHALHKRLAAIDPSSAAKIHPNDSRRIIRALEVFRTTRKTMTELKSATRGLKDTYEVAVFGLSKPRGQLYETINARVDTMCGMGLVDEVRRLLKRRLSRTANAALGLKEIAGYLTGDYGLNEAKELLKRNTRRFAKRQLAWFRPDTRIRWFDVSKASEDAIVEKIERVIDERKTQSVKRETTAKNSKRFEL